MTYVDDEGDTVTISSDEELVEAVNLALSISPSVLRLTVHPLGHKANTAVSGNVQEDAPPEDTQLGSKQLPQDVAALMETIANQIPKVASQVPNVVRNFMPPDVAASVSDHFIHKHQPNAKPGVHEGITCDKSGMSPIIGNRYHLVGHNYDLCEDEFQVQRPPIICPWR